MDIVMLQRIATARELALKRRGGHVELSGPPAAIDLAWNDIKAGWPHLDLGCPAAGVLVINGVTD